MTEEMEVEQKEQAVGQEKLRTVLELTPAEVRKYFMEPKNYCTLDLPEYIDFKPVLEYVEKTVGDTAFGSLLENNHVKPRDYEDINHKLLIKKDARYTFRSTNSFSSRCTFSPWYTFCSTNSFCPSS